MAGTRDPPCRLYPDSPCIANLFLSAGELGHSDPYGQNSDLAVGISSRSSTDLGFLEFVPRSLWKIVYLWNRGAGDRARAKPLPIRLMVGLGVWDRSSRPA